MVTGTAIVINLVGILIAMVIICWSMYLAYSIEELLNTNEIITMTILILGFIGAVLLGAFVSMWILLIWLILKISLTMIITSMK